MRRVQTGGRQNVSGDPSAPRTGSRGVGDRPPSEPGRPDARPVRAAVRLVKSVIKSVVPWCRAGCGRAWAACQVVLACFVTIIWKKESQAVSARSRRRVGPPPRARRSGPVAPPNGARDAVAGRRRSENLIPHVLERAWAPMLCRRRAVATPCSRGCPVPRSGLDT